MNAINFSEIKHYLKDGFDIFLTSLFSNIIISGGILVLGIFHSVSIVGIYTAIDKLVRAGVGLFAVVTQAIFPNIAKRFVENKKLAIKTIINIGTKTILLLSVVCVILMLCSSFILRVIYTVTFEPYAYVLCILLVWVIVSFINNFIGIQFLVGSGNSKYYRRSFTIATLYILSSFILIKNYAIDGLLFSILSGEISLSLAMMYFIKKNRLAHD